MNDPAELALRDIHLPEAVSWWPPALGWWIVFVLILLLAAIIFLLRVRNKRRQFQRVMLAEIQNIYQQFSIHQSARQYVRNLSVLLRRICISHYPRRDVAGLTGDQWLRFLEQAVQDNVSFSRGAGRALVTGPYQPDIKIDVEALNSLCHQWAMQLPLKPQSLKSQRLKPQPLKSQKDVT